MKLFAEFISFLFHPVLFLLLVPFLLIYKETHSGYYALKWQLFTSLFIIFGLFVFLIGRWRGIFSDFDLSKKEERGKFYLIAALLSFTYLAISIAFKGFLFPLSIVGMALILGIVIFNIVNRYIKASIHVAGISSFVLAAGILFGNMIFFATFFLVPLVAWARITLKRHTPTEVFVGGVLGVILTLVTALVGKYLQIQ